jgi:hypothetical protein
MKMSVLLTLTLGVWDEQCAATKYRWDPQPHKQALVAVTSEPQIHREKER